MENAPWSASRRCDPLGQRHRRRVRGCQWRLRKPPILPTALECDAVGVAERTARQVMAALPRSGCVFAHGERWWWIVPSRSHIGVNWPPMARYAIGALVTASLREGTGRHPESPRLIHCPDDTVPYTHPLLLYTAVCSIAGVPPSWSGGDRPPGPENGPNP